MSVHASPTLPREFFQCVRQAKRLDPPLWIKASRRTGEARFVVTNANGSAPLFTSDDILEIRSWLRARA